MCIITPTGPLLIILSALSTTVGFSLWIQVFWFRTAIHTFAFRFIQTKHMKTSLSKAYWGLYFQHKTRSQTEQTLFSFSTKANLSTCLAYGAHPMLKDNPTQKDSLNSSVGTKTRIRNDSFSPTLQLINTFSSKAAIYSKIPRAQCKIHA